MMETKHTPGPWHVGNVSSDERQVVSAAMFDNGYSRMSCRVFDGALGKYSEEMEANARLIAAAPELLEACKLMKKAIANEQAIGQLSDYTEGFEASFDNMVAAIAAAEGK